MHGVVSWSYEPYPMPSILVLLFTLLMHPLLSLGIQGTWVAYIYRMCFTCYFDFVALSYHPPSSTFTTNNGGYRYHKFALSLGEHYNSVIPLEVDQTE
jgi:hypothetical protein